MTAGTPAQKCRPSEGVAIKTTGRNNPPTQPIPTKGNARVKRYHGQPPTHTFPPNVKPAPLLDVRDPWRQAIAADGRLGPGALRVALILLNFANRSGSCSVGVHRIATEVRRDRRNVERGLRQLVVAGYLEREARGGVPGRGGRTCATSLKVPATASSKVPAAAAEVPAAARRSTGGGESKVPATVAGETLLTHITPAAAGPGFEAGTASAQNQHAGSATAGRNGEVLRLGRELEAPRVGPSAVGLAVLAGLRSKFGYRAQGSRSHNENSAPADHGGGSGVDALKAK